MRVARRFPLRTALAVAALAGSGCDFGIPVDLTPLPTGPSYFWIDAGRYALGIGDTTRLNVVGGSTATLVSLQPSIATVGTNGLVTAHSVGRAVFQATSGTTTAAVTISVFPSLCTVGSPIGTVAVPASAAGALASTSCGLGNRPSWASWWPPGPMYSQVNGRTAEGRTLTITDTTIVRFIAASTAFDPLLVVMNPAMEAIGHQLRHADTAYVVRKLAPGDYIVWTASAGETATGSYTLSSTFATLCDPTVMTGSISAGQTVADTLSLTECFDPGSFLPTHRWSLTLAANTSLSIELPSAPPSTNLRAIAPDGNSSGWLTTVLNCFGPGTHTIVVAGHDWGSYRLLARPVTLPCNP